MFLEVRVCAVLLPTRQLSPPLHREKSWATLSPIAFAFAFTRTRFPQATLQQCMTAAVQ